jgi:10-bladed beta propeller domain
MKKVCMILILEVFYCLSGFSQYLAAFSDNMDYFYVFDAGQIVQLEYQKVKDFSVGGNCVLYKDSRSRLKMYYKGKVSELSVNEIKDFIALDYLAVYSYAGIIYIIENGNVKTINTHSLNYIAQDSVVAFYDDVQSFLAAYYHGRIYHLEDGLLANQPSSFRCGDNIIAYVSARTGDLMVFYQGGTYKLEQFVSEGTYKAGKDIVAYMNAADQKFKVFYRGETFVIEDFPPLSYKTGDGIVAYVDNSGRFKVFSNGEVTDISSSEPGFYDVQNRIVVYEEQGYFKTWYKDQFYTIENYVPTKWKAQWNTIVYIDQNRNIRVFRDGEDKVLTYDIVEDMDLYRDVIVTNKGMNIHNVYYNGRKY